MMGELQTRGVKTVATVRFDRIYLGRKADRRLHLEETRQNIDTCQRDLLRKHRKCMFQFSNKTSVTPAR